MTILEKMLEQGAHEGYATSDNIKKIAKAKSMMFGEADWKRCPCDNAGGTRYCISEACRQDIEKDGVCLCRCYYKLSAAE